VNLHRQSGLADAGKETAQDVALEVGLDPRRGLLPVYDTPKRPGNLLFAWLSDLERPIENKAYTAVLNSLLNDTPRERIQHVYGHTQLQPKFSHPRIELGATRDGQERIAVLDLDTAGQRIGIDGIVNQD
jgi:hypothetical protein